MRSTLNRKTVAAAYGLGLIWTVALIGGAVVLTQPLLELYGVLGIESMLVQGAVTLSLVILLASAVTGGVGLVVRAVSGHVPARPQAAPEVASHHA